VAARPGVLATAADLIAPGDRVLIDARAPEEYRGEAAPPAMPRRGRLPDALSLDWRRLTDEAGILDDAGLERVLAGVPRGREVVVYCQSAARSAVLYQALRHLGFDARNYLGSAGEWLSDPALPVESGPGREL
ncbi:MAG TPA: rhodanese-like domain-containing protein, partial [Deinococcales bacterium]|nr:rhodanese-like domain-containing protein [Deinococcales bacterium]